VLQEAAAFPGPSLVIAYAHCIAHGYDLAHGVDHQKAAVDSGYWPIYHFDPRRVDEGLPPLVIDAPHKGDLQEYLSSETRFQRAFVDRARRERAARWALYEKLSTKSV
jgi:pyruvate-ferredoxin/flavodoxin oxidoreductase